LRAEFGRGRKKYPDLVRGIIAELHDAELFAVRIEFVDEMAAISTRPPSK